ncbi:hypothetical protein D1007_11617 [Hordeum vulgare]|nr:hypothetical protein D1007_11617 [Hordeum vulgare]
MAGVGAQGRRAGVAAGRLCFPSRADDGWALRACRFDQTGSVPVHNPTRAQPQVKPFFILRSAGSTSPSAALSAGSTRHQPFLRSAGDISRPTLIARQALWAGDWRRSLTMTGGDSLRGRRRDGLQACPSPHPSASASSHRSTPSPTPPEVHLSPSLPLSLFLSICNKLTGN